MKMPQKFTVQGYELDSIDFKIIFETQVGIPIVSNPYQVIANKLGLEEDVVLNRLNNLKKLGFVRKVAGTPNHYKIGYTANAMTVWDIPDDLLDQVGSLFKTTGFVSHCYVRPRILPDWNYNLFAMVHGKSRQDVAQQVDLLKKIVEGKFRSVELIYSTQILKKTGIRLKGDSNV